MCPNPRIGLPFLAVSPVEFFSSFPIKTDNSSFHIAESAILCANITVSSQSHVIVIDANDTVKNIVSGGYFCQDRITHSGMGGLCH